MPAPPAAEPPRAGALLLFPTELEHRRFRDQGEPELPGVREAVCGFGPVAAAARTAQLLGRLHPERVLLCGIAGSFDLDRAPLGEAVEFDAVALHGVGAGEGDAFQGPPALGFPQWPGSDDTRAEAIEERLPLDPPDAVRALGGGLLLTTCAASASEAEAARRRARFPEAVAEDMEGFGVALACALFRTPVRVVRGVSNRVGDRDAASWRIPAALAAARRAVLAALGPPVA